MPAVHQSNNPSALIGQLSEPWLWQVITVVLVIIAINVGAYYLLRHVEKIASRTRSVWDDALIKAARLPVTLLLWTLGTSVALRIVHQHTSMLFFDWVVPGRNVLVIIALPGC